MRLHFAIPASVFAFCLVANARATTDCAQITRSADEATVVADSIRPIESIANALAGRHGILISAEEPQYLFAGDMEDVSIADPEWSAQHPKTHYLVPRRRRLEVRFPVLPDGSPRDMSQLLRQIVERANTELSFKYRLDIDGEFSTFVPVTTRDPAGRASEAKPLLDRLVTIAPGIRSLAQSGRLMADSLSLQTGLQVTCCQTLVGGIPWGLAEFPFEAHNESARRVLQRLIQLNMQSEEGSRMYWTVQCDSEWCSIELHRPWDGECSRETASW